MKYFACITLLLSIFIFGSCQPFTKVYIVRHAEKNTQQPNDPHLNEVGKSRAETLKQLLKDKEIGYIFSTNTNRTIETAVPISKVNNVEIQLYSMDTLKGFLQRVTSLKKNTLIIGHSNTVLSLLDGFGVAHTVKVIADNDYNNLFIVTIKNSKAVGVEEAVYGNAK